MTLAPLLIPRRFPLTSKSGRRQLIEVAPGNQVLVMLHQSPGVRGDSLILLLHGLESSADAHYVKGVCEKALHEGYSVARMNMRNCGGTSHLSTTLYNAGMSRDVLLVAENLANTFGFKRVFLCGFSLGGNVVLKAAGEHGNSSSPPLAGVCSICPPVDLESCVRQMEKGINRIYEKNFVISLKLRIYEKSRHFPGRYDLEKLRTIRTVRGFDNAFTAPDAGYDSAEDYYHEASALRVLDKIEMPALIIAAQDDPLVPFASFETMAEPSENYRGALLAPANGGHVSFITDRAMRIGTAGVSQCDKFWAEWKALEFFNHCTTGGATSC
jgi:predicted alpha/beta-fold hydrolase